MVTASLKHGVKFRENEFSRIGHLITMTAFSPGRVDLLLSVISFHDINYIVFVFQYGFTITSSMVQLHIAGGALATTKQENSCAECVRAP